MGLPSFILPIMGKSNLDPNAQAFITAASITNATQRSAINTLVKDLKAAGIWSKFTAIYPFVGGNATAHSFNLVNTALYQITFVGGVTHSANGIQGNGTNGYANTNLLGNVLPQDNNHLSVYSRTSGTNANYDVGTAVSGTRVLGFRAATGGPPVFIEAYNNNLTLTTAFNTVSTGLQLWQRTASNASAYYRGDGGLVSSNIAASNGTCAFNFFIGSVNVSGSPSGFNNRNYAFASFGQSLTSGELASFYTIVQAYQTTLGRQV